MAKNKKLTIKTAGRAIESIAFTEETGLGVRIIREGALGYAYSTGIDRASIETVVAKAKDSADQSEPDTANVLAAKKEIYELPGLFDESTASMPVEEKIGFLLSMEEKAMKADPRVIGAETAVYVDSDEQITVLNSNGAGGSCRSNGCYAYMALLAKDGEETQAGTGFTCSRSFSGLDGDSVVFEAVDTCTGLLGAKPIDSGRLTVLMPPMVAVEFVGTIASSASAEAVFKNRSLFAGKMGTQVAAESISICDNGRMHDALGSAPFDHEGTPTGETHVIDEGVLRSFLYDSKAAKRDQAESTGNGFRASYTSVPGINPTNFFIKPGAVSFAEMLSGVDYGLFVQEVQGFHSGVNPISGEFSVGASGWVIRNGVRAEPFREVTIAGDLLGFFKSIEAIGSDLRFLPMAGNLGSPSLLANGIIVSGK